MPLEGDPKPYPKSKQTARAERRYRRKVASAKQWQAIAAEKQGPCRCCRCRPPNELHHLIPRDRGGDDVADNIVPVCRSCHSVVEVRGVRAVRQLLASLTDREYAYMVTTGGEDVFERIYRLEFKRG